jgi:UDP-N-acetylmuramate--alanine ligase
VRIAGKVEPVFVEDVAAMPAEILSAVRDGDVVIAMGAGSIGTVPGQVRDAAAAAAGPAGAAPIRKGARHV